MENGLGEVEVTVTSDTITPTDSTERGYPYHVEVVFYASGTRVKSAVVGSNRGYVYIHEADEIYDGIVGDWSE